MHKGIDNVIGKPGLFASEEADPALRTGYDTEVITELDLDSAGVKTIVWATGYATDFKTVVNCPIWDKSG